MPKVVDTEVIQVRMPVAMADHLRSLSKHAERTLAAEVRLALRDYLADRPVAEVAA